MATYKKILKDGSKVQVDSAIRDGNGAKIDTNYQKKLPTTTTANQVLKSTSTAGTYQFGDVDRVLDQKTGALNKFWTGTKAEYEALGTHDANTFYNITDDNGGLGSQIVTLYDKDITAVNLGYASGIPSSTEFTLDITGYKFIKIYYQMYFGAAYNTGGNCNILELGINTSETWNIAHGNPFYYDNGTIRAGQFAIDYRFNTSTKKNTVYFFNGGAEATSGSAYHIFRIEGVK